MDPTTIGIVAGLGAAGVGVAYYVYKAKGTDKTPEGPVYASFGGKRTKTMTKNKQKSGATTLRRRRRGAM